MMLSSRDKPKIKSGGKKGDGFEGWLKCQGCQEMVHQTEVAQCTQCCPKCGYHYRLSAKERIAMLSDPGTFQEMFQEIVPVDKLNFFDTEKYEERIVSAQKKTGNSEAIFTGTCRLNEHPVALAVMNFSFMGGSMGSCVGEKLTLLIEYALEKRLPLIVVSASGGARMQESVFSLMQMAKTSAALAKLHEGRVPYISVLTDPTSGGVTASFASLGDIIVAEPGALICFAGPRVVEQTIRQKLPKGAQTAEFLLKHGMIDGIVKRSAMKQKLATFLEFLTP